jgi:FMN-dependent NADH-azoreductase
MPTLLHLDSSADLGRSRSRSIGRTFVNSWLACDPANTVSYRDLHLNPPPHLPDAALHWPARLRPATGERSDATPPIEGEQLQAELIAELLASDVLLVAAPMYNYSLPSSLKAWVDHIHVPGVTAPFDVASQPMAGRPAVVVTSRGGSYDAGTPTADWDHGIPVLQLILGNSLGMTVSVISTSLTLAEDLPDLADQIDRSHAELVQANQAAVDAAESLSAAANA